jgi:hypothetical protein
MTTYRIGTAQNADDHLHVQFRHVAKVDDVATAKTGATVWRNVEYITITIPGDRTFVYDGEVTERHRDRFATRYGRWKSGQADAPDGTPLSAWPGITPAELNTLAQGGIHTVEGLAGLSDGNAGKVGPVLALRDKARKYLEAARESAPIELLNAKLREKDSQIATLTEQMQGLMARMETNMAMLTQRAAPVGDAADTAMPPRRGPGRPPKPKPDALTE